MELRKRALLKSRRQRCALIAVSVFRAVHGVRVCPQIRLAVYRKGVLNIHGGLRARPIRVR